MVKRDIEVLLKDYCKNFRSVMLVGPRQSGKTTLAKTVFKLKPYVSLENPDVKQLADDDPRGFLSNYPNGAILDEVQRAPQLFNYLQEILDNTKKDGLFILTGSNNLMLQQNINQSLAGRVGILDVLPFTNKEVEKLNLKNFTTNDYILRGSYPEIYHKKRNHILWYQSYIKTYVERDIRLIKNIENNSLFIKFIKLCAGRTGQQLNMNSLCTECGIDVKTANAWLSILQSTFIIKLLPPFYQSYNKRIVKTPKMYFYDTGLACSLLQIKDNTELSNSHFKGALFENLIIMEIYKEIINCGKQNELYYWRDNNGLEIDLIIDTGSKIIPVEIKSTQTYQSNLLKSLKKFCEISETDKGYLLYDGNLNYKLENKFIVSNWKQFKLND